MLHTLTFFKDRVGRGKFTTQKSISRKKKFMKMISRKNSSPSTWVNVWVQYKVLYFQVSNIIFQPWNRDVSDTINHFTTYISKHSWNTCNFREIDFTEKFREIEFTENISNFFRIRLKVLMTRHPAVKHQGGEI